MIKDPSFIYLATILPPILIGIMIWKSDRFPEPGKFLVASFLLGVSIYLPLDLLIMITEDHLAPLLGLDMNAYKNYEVGDQTPVGEHAFQMFFRAAFLEEGLKFALLIFFCVRLSDLNEPMDAIVYGAAIGLGYAAMENIPYLNTGDPETAWTMTVVKQRYYPLIMHLGFGVIMGWLLSLNLFGEQSAFKRRLMLILALAIPVIFHGSYNYLGAFDVFPILTLIMVTGIIYYYRREQLKKITEDMDKSKIENIDVFYSYLITFAFVSVVVLSAVYANN
ncbi:PrsW family glutamic-type intramembrane protease [Candidatus Pelagibacter ubique]|nr:PrsW family glutamic-type intramembrane protease [Candidatus Pelagibacter ubique]